MFRTTFIVIGLFLLGSCSPQRQVNTSQSPFDPYFQTVIDQEGQMVAIDHGIQNQATGTQKQLHANGRVAILLPLSGPQKSIGESMLKAAQLALFDVNDPTFELIPLDTKSTSAGASAAVIKAAGKNVKLILGPLLSQSVQAAGQSARRYNLNVIGFTTDSRHIGANVSTLGILPFDQGQRLAKYASKNRLNRIAIIDQNNTYARAVISAFEQTGIRNNIKITHKILFSANDNANIIAQTLANLKSDFDALLIPVGTPQITRLAEALNTHGLGANKITWMGAGIWDNQSIKSNIYMKNAVFAAPPPNLRQNFERQYQSVYGVIPKRLASLAYDATALSIVMLRQNGGRVIGKNQILNPNGFAGIDGIFRFKSNGMAERGLAIHHITGTNRTNIIDQAPNSFLTTQ